MGIHTWLTVLHEICRELSDFEKSLLKKPPRILNMKYEPWKAMSKLLQPSYNLPSYILHTVYIKLIDFEITLV
jgi:hypothetical protein